MENTSENETPLFGKKPKVEEPVAAPVTATPAAPAAPAPKKTSVGLIIGAIITAAALIAASVVLVIVLINRIPSGSSDKKSDESSKEEKKDEPVVDKDDDKDEDEDEDEDKDVDEDKDKDEDVDKDEDEDTDEDEEEEDNNTSAQTGNYTLGINGKSFKFGSKDFATVVKNALNAGYKMTYQDVNYKDHDLTSSNLDSYLKSEVKYGSEVAIVDANGDDILTINGSKDYTKSGTQTVADMKYDNIYYAATTPLTLPNGKKVSCYNTTKQEIFDIYGKTEVSSLDIARYHKDGLNISFHLDDKDTVSAVFIRLD